MFGIMCSHNQLGTLVARNVSLRDAVPSWPMHYLRIYKVSISDKARSNHASSLDETRSTIMCSVSAPKPSVHDAAMAATNWYTLTSNLGCWRS